MNFDPLAMATCTEHLSLLMVRDTRTEETLNVREWITTRSQGEIHALRTYLRRQPKTSTIFSCFCCGLAVHIAKHKNGGYHFRHRSMEDAMKANCIYRDEASLSIEAINRMRYQGLREGARHIRTKALIERILKADPRFSGVAQEQVWRTFGEGWRKPDVSGRWHDLNVVFEAQVSNTYPQVVAERTNFYADQEALLIWIFDAHPGSHWRALHADTFCANDQHLFVVDESVATLSEATGRAHFLLLTMQPDVVPQTNAEGYVGLSVESIERFQPVPFDLLQLDVHTQTATLFDLSDEHLRAQHKVLCAEVQVTQRWRSLEAALLALLNRPGSTLDGHRVRGWAALVCAIEAQRLQVAVGTKFPNPDSLLNHVYDHHPYFVAALISTLQRLDLTSSFHRGKAWAARARDFAQGRYQSGACPAPHPLAPTLLAWLYPDRS